MPRAQGVSVGWEEPTGPVTPERAPELDLLSKRRQRSSKNTYHRKKYWECITKNL